MSVTERTLPIGREVNAEDRLEMTLHEHDAATRAQVPNSAEGVQSTVTAARWQYEYQDPIARNQLNQIRFPQLNL